MLISVVFFTTVVRCCNAANSSLIIDGEFEIISKGIDSVCF